MQLKPWGSHPVSPWWLGSDVICPVTLSLSAAMNQTMSLHTAWSQRSDRALGRARLCVCVMHVFNYFLLLWFPRRNRTARRLRISEPCYRDIFGKSSVFLGLQFLRGMRVMFLFSRCSECVCSMICAVWVAVGHLYHVCIPSTPRVCQRKAYVCVWVWVSGRYLESVLYQEKWRWREV